MILGLTYAEMAYIRELLQKDSNHRDTINEELRKKILDKIQLIENDIANDLIRSE